MRALLRVADARDADAIADLHAESWRRTYRGAVSETYLESGVFSERQIVWRARFADAASTTQTIVAEMNDEVVGFVHTVLDEDATYGSLVDNLHVAHVAQRQGLGSRLMAASAAVVLGHARSAGVYLWVLEMNRGAQAFYESIGGVHLGDQIVTSPAGDENRALRYIWPDPTVLMPDDRS